MACSLKKEFISEALSRQEQGKGDHGVRQAGVDRALAWGDEEVTGCLDFTGAEEAKKTRRGKEEGKKQTDC